MTLVAIGIAVVAILVAMAAAIYMAMSPQQEIYTYLTPEQEARIDRDNELRSAYVDLTVRLGRAPTVRELWAETPPR